MTNFSVVDDTFDPTITLSYFLSIRVSPDGFSFCTLDPVRNKYIQMQHVDFVKNIPHAQQVEDCFSRIEKLNLPYKKTMVLSPTNISTLVPSALFDKSTSSEWLNFSHQTEPNKQLVYNKVKMADAYNIFTVADDIYQILKRQYSDPIFYHQHTPIIESILSTKNTEADNTLLFLNVEHDFFDILAFSNNNLKLCNTFTIKSANDFIYFTLFVFEQLKLKPSSTEVIISGNHEHFNQLVKHLSQYIKKVKQNKMPHHFQYSHQFKELNGNEFYNLLSLPVCV